MKRFWFFLSTLLIVLLGQQTWAAPASFGDDYGITTRESVDATGNSFEGQSSQGVVSNDGRWVAFRTYPTITQFPGVIYLRDRLNATTTLITVGYTGGQANGSSNLHDISADGEWILFDSFATNLVPNDTNDAHDVFLWERATGTIRRISVSSSGAQGSGEDYFIKGAISADGRYSAFLTTMAGLVPNDTNNRADIFVHDRITGETTRISVSNSGTQANNYSEWLAISDDGQWITYASTASNLVPNDTNGKSDIFLYNRLTAEVSRISNRINGTQSSEASYTPTISGNGQLIAFTTLEDLAMGGSASLESVYLYDRLSDTITLGVQGDDGSRIQAKSPLLSADGSELFFVSSNSELVPQDTNFANDVFGWERATATAERLSVGTYDEQGSDASTLSAVSADGTFVIWNSAAPEFVPGDNNGLQDVFLRERTDSPPPSPTATATITPTATATPRISPYPNEQFLPITARQSRFTESFINLTRHANGASFAPVVSHDGTIVAFTSAANNLVPNDTNNATDVFVWERAGGQIVRVSIANNNMELQGASERPALSEDGRYVVYTAWADGGVPEDTNGRADIYRYDRLTGDVVLVSTGIAGGGDGDSVHADVSADGQVVVFTSAAHNLTSEGAPGVPAGVRVAYVRHLATQSTTLLRFNGTGNIFQYATSPSISDDGTKVALAVWGYPSALCSGQPIGLIDVVTGASTTIATAEVNHRWEYMPGAPRISPDGTLVAYRFYVQGGALPQGYSLHIGGAEQERIATFPVNPSTCDGPPDTAPKIALSASNRWVAFAATDLMGQTPNLPSDTNGYQDIFLHERTTHYTRLISATAAAASNGNSFDPYISGDGRTLLFASDASNLVPDDTNAETDIILWSAE